MNVRAGAVAWGLVLAVVTTSAAAATDHWEFSANGDDDVTTDNVLFHGAEQIHLLTLRHEEDEDWYVVFTRPFSSYQVVVHGLTGSLDLTGTNVQLMNMAGTQVVLNAVAPETGLLSLQWYEGNLSNPLQNFVRVHSPDCGSMCGTSEGYRIRFYDTTYTVPRVNNSGTQSSVLLVQNATDRPCTMSTHYFDNAGSHVVTGPLTLIQPYAQDVVATAATFPGQSGSVRVTHTCGYGGLSGKAVSLEASTGFTFDTPFVHRPH